jgi:hypothetical protein
MEAVDRQELGKREREAIQAYLALEQADLQVGVPLALEGMLDYTDLDAGHLLAAFERLEELGLATVDRSEDGGANPAKVIISLETSAYDLG